MKRRLLGVIVVAIGVFVLGTTAAHASIVQYAISDPLYDQIEGGNPPLAAKKQVDIVGVTYGRGTHRVWVRIYVRDLNRQYALPRIYFVSKHKNYAFQWENFGVYPNLIGPKGREVCRSQGILRTNYRANYMQMGFPKSCFRKGYLLRRPRAVVAGWSNNLSDSTMRGHSFYPNP